jgi:hypothetical protein
VLVEIGFLVKSDSTRNRIEDETPWCCWNEPTNRKLFRLSSNDNLGSILLVERNSAEMRIAKDWYVASVQWKISWLPFSMESIVSWARHRDVTKSKGFENDGAVAAPSFEPSTWLLAERMVRYHVSPRNRNRQGPAFWPAH